LSFDEYKNNEKMMLHELSGFFFAGMKTIQYSTMNMIYYLTKHPEFKEKLLKEILPPIEAVKDDIVKKLDYDTVQEFDYLQCCYNESLRIEAPAPISIPMTVVQPCSFGEGKLKFTLQPGDIFLTLTQEIHKDPAQWINPHEYNPARFDKSGDSPSKWQLAADGKVRNPMAFTPFFGGKRICLGKTFAEQVIRFTLPLLFHHFAFDFVDPKQADHKEIFSADGLAVTLPFQFTIRNKA